MTTRTSKDKITIIKPPDSNFEFRLALIWEFRELILAFFSRDIKVRYAQTWAGWAWAIFNPLINIIILSFVFGKIANVDTDGVNPFLFTTVGMAGWIFFSSIVNDAGTTLINHQSMIQKVYFPRIVLPLSKGLLALFDFSILLLLIGIIFILNKQGVSTSILYLPLAVALAIAIGLGAGIWTAALTVKFRDFRFIVPLAIRLGMYITPIAFPLSAVPSQYKMLFSFNPLVGVIEVFRYALLDISPDIRAVSYSLVISILLLISGLLYFNKVDDDIADII